MWQPPSLPHHVPLGAFSQRIVCECVQGMSEEEIAAELAPGPEDPQALSPEEEEERAQLLRDGFSGWNRRDFQAFVRAAEKYGRTELDKIAGEIEGKPKEEVVEYSKVGTKGGEGLSHRLHTRPNVRRPPAGDVSGTRSSVRCMFIKAVEQQTAGRLSGCFLATMCCLNVRAPWYQAAESICTPF